MLNNYKAALKLQWHNIKHDKTLRIITEMAQSHLHDGYYLISDLGEEEHHFPSSIVPTDLCPDLVMWSDCQRSWQFVLRLDDASMMLQGRPHATLKLQVMLELMVIAPPLFQYKFEVLRGVA